MSYTLPLDQKVSKFLKPRLSLPIGRRDEETGHPMVE